MNTAARSLVAVLLAVSVAACTAADDAPRGEVTATDPLILISLDGFRWDYPDLADTPNLDRLIARGVRAEGMIPVFPSKTFPSHYSIVTGLHPGHHGIISNNMRDPRWPEPFGLSKREQVNNARWWGGEPIWVTAHNAGLRTASYFWPGSEAPIQGVRPDIWFPFDGSVPWNDRVDAALGWLELPTAERPTFMTLYFAETDTKGHGYGPGSAEALVAVTAVDAALGRLLDGLEARDRLDSTNLVVVSDHGMTELDPEERVIVLSDYVELSSDEVFEAGAWLQIFPAAGREDEIYDALVGAHPHLRIFRPQEAPDEFRLYENSRLAPILGTPDAGWDVKRVPARATGRPTRGAHGYDPAHTDMHGIFVAAGPGFEQGATVPRLPGVDIYNILARVLNIEPAPNDGNPERLTGIVREQQGGRQ
jgi:predicted AlkP superfamily pyrophosphatase or phosphodiesterase